MSESHSLTEAVHPYFQKEGLWRARERTLHLFSEIKRQLVLGMNEIEARRLALRVADELGAQKHWHQPYIRFGQGTALSFHEPLRKENTFQKNFPVSIDLGPVWPDSDRGLEYEGDFGDSFVIG